jgi:hypothetical protein
MKEYTFTRRYGFYAEGETIQIDFFDMGETERIAWSELMDRGIIKEAKE